MRRSAVNETCPPPRWAKAAPSPCCMLQGLRANNAPVAALRPVTIVAPDPMRDRSNTHSTKAVTARRRVANPAFGFQVAADGGGFTWARNSRDNQLNPWSNDPVSDHSGEIIYLQDLDSGVLWTPTAQPIPIEQASYLARHGRGYSHFEVATQGIKLDLMQYVPAGSIAPGSRPSWGSGWKAMHW